MTAANPQHTAHNGATTAELVNKAASQVSILVRDELALARAELMEKGKKVGVGSGLFGTAGILALYGVGLILTLLVVALDLVWPLWLAVLVVMLLVFAAAAVAALMGRREIQRATPLTPTEAVAGVAADVETVKVAVRGGRP